MISLPHKPKIVEKSGNKAIFEKVVKLAANYLLSDLRGILVEHESSINEAETVQADNFANLIMLLVQEKITSRVAKDVLREMFSTGRSPEDAISKMPSSFAAPNRFLMVRTMRWGCCLGPSK